MKKNYLDIFKEVENDHIRNIDNTKNSRVLIVDGLNTFIRCWSSVPTMNEDGDHVAGITCVLKSIGFAVRKVQPTRVIIVFDGKGGSQSRKKVFSGYKEKRSQNKLRVNRQYKDMLNDEDERASMKRQYLWLSDTLDNLPVTTMIYDGVEADDVMAYIATNLLKESEQAVLMSTDKDFLQLINERVTVWSPTKKKLYDKEMIKEEFGIESKNLLLYRMMDGDPSDEIPGVKGCGLKTLHKRLPELCGDEKLNLDDLLNLAKEKQGKIQIYNTILEAESQLRMNERLMQLSDVDISGIIKMQILDRFDEPTKPLNRMDFIKTCMKYKMANSFGTNVDSWLQSTWSKMICDV